MEKFVIKKNYLSFDIHKNQLKNFDKVSSELKNLKKVSNEFESIFINQLMKQIRKSEIAEGIFSSSAEDTFNGLIDEEYSKIISEKSNFGISEALFNQFKLAINNKAKK